MSRLVIYYHFINLDPVKHRCSEIFSWNKLLLVTVWTERWVPVSESHGSLSSAPSRNLQNMTPDLQGYVGRCTLASLVPRLLGQCSPGSPASFPPDTAQTCYLLAVSTDSSPLLSIDFPFGSLSLPSCYLAGCFRLVAQFAATCSCPFLARGFFYPEDGGDTFLWNVGLH
jgi:hypothetical protein